LFSMANCKKCIACAPTWLLRCVCVCVFSVRV
jgi:hypothetical protein